MDAFYEEYARSLVESLDGDEMGTFALAYQEAIHARDLAELEAAEKAEKEALALAWVRVYDPLSPPDDLRMYEGTGIGALYGLPGTDRFLPELQDWRVIAR